MFVSIASLFLMLAGVDAPAHTALCLENTDGDKMLWVSVAEKYESGSKTVRQVELKRGQKQCFRYHGLKEVTVNHYYMGEVQRRIAQREPMNPWDAQSCPKVVGKQAVFFRLKGDEAGVMSCSHSPDHDSAAVRTIVERESLLSG